MPAKQLTKPTRQLNGPPKMDNAEDTAAASSETKLSKMIAAEAKRVAAIMVSHQAAFCCSLRYLSVDGSTPKQSGTGTSINPHITAMSA